MCAAVFIYHVVWIQCQLLLNAVKLRAAQPCRQLC